MNKTCAKCGGELEAGVATVHGLIGEAGGLADQPALLFIVLGTPTAPGLAAAFKQGLEDEPANRTYGIRGFRCSNCGVLELYAEA